MSKGWLYFLILLNAACCAFNVLEFTKTHSVISFGLAAMCGYFLWTYLNRLGSEDADA
jgi:hypothetical protein